MQEQEYINLCLSTDDEERLPRFPSELNQGKAGGSNDHDFSILSEDIDIYQQERCPKRRRISLGETDSEIIAVGNEGSYGSRKSVTLPRQILSTRLSASTSQNGGQLDHELNLNISTFSKKKSPITSSYAIDLSDQCDLHDDSSDSFPDDITHLPNKKPKQHTGLSTRTASLLNRIEKPTVGSKVRRNRRHSDKENDSHDKSQSEVHDGDGKETESVQRSSEVKASKKAKLTDSEKLMQAEARAALKSITTAQKAKEKEDRKEHKKLEKEAKLKEKQKAAALAEVNRLKLDKKLTGPDMIVDLPVSLDGQAVDTQVREFLKNLQIEATSYQSPVANLITWRRKVKSRFNEELGYWEPLDAMRIVNEKHVLCLMSAQEFVNLVSLGSEEPDGISIETHVSRLKSHFEDCKPIYLIEGLEVWMRKNKSTLNRAYQAAVISSIDAQVPPAQDERPTGKSRRGKASSHYIDEDIVEDALLRLQVVEECLVHHTATTVETAEWVANFTQHISTIPAR